MSKAPGIGGWDALETYPKKMQDELLKAYNAEMVRSGSERSVQNRILFFRHRKILMQHIEHFRTFL